MFERWGEVNERGRVEVLRTRVERMGICGKAGRVGTGSCCSAIMLPLVVVQASGRVDIGMESKLGCLSTGLEKLAGSGWR